MRRGLGLTEPPEVTQWRSFADIYLMENQLTKLPEDPRCPVLLILFLNRNYKLGTISPSFFDHMPALEILNLSRTRIKSLPESLFRLSPLKRLFLNHCELLMVLPSKIGELQQLEVLDLEGTEIMDLPKEVAKLTKLTCLEVSFCRRINQGTKSVRANALIPQGTISALSQLEELSIDVNPEDERWESVVEAIVDDVCGLISLDTLKLYLQRVEYLRKFKWFGTYKLSDFGIENMEQLKCCIIGECNEIRVIIDGTDMYDEADRSGIVSEILEDDTRLLKSLEYLYVYPQGIPNDASREQPAPPVVLSTTTVNVDRSTSKLKRAPKVAPRPWKFKFNDLKLAARNFSAASPLGKAGFGCARGFTNEVSIVAPRLREFSLKDLKLATRNFSPEGLLGQGGFGRVFRGWIKGNGIVPPELGTGLTVAVKILNSGQRTHEQWLAEVSILGHLVHRNLVHLIGYCVEGNQRLLIYEYMQRGSLNNHLLETELPLTWRNKTKIALQAAEILAFLHGKAEPPVIFRNFKPSKILLDDDYNVKLTGFGLATVLEGDDSHSGTVVRTLGYIDQEYLMRGHVTVKSGVYGFGMVLSEILTGRKPFDLIGRGRSSVMYFWSHREDERILPELMDPRLTSEYSKKGAQISLQLAVGCLELDPDARPWMSEVVEVLKTIQYLPYMPSTSDIEDKTGKR
ncbi:uncharacterized protein LOC104454758 [Eucalyptus grandis]|uniref:uncharacterized protein LOC104454758 n=1 Tax=Eucalyptus grandis TaxID=71139 RepID=UPI00192ED3F2|nr:uncharacterized protein LOC104454758 [Eucalyptus grandis]